MKFIALPILLTLSLCCPARAAENIVINEGANPRIAMLWSSAKGDGRKLDRWARYAVLVTSPDELGLVWERHDFPDLAEKFQPESIPKARKFLSQLQEQNSAARVLVELYFFEADVKAYPPDSPWWFRDQHGKTVEFWKGCRNMAVGNPDYLDHVIRRIEAVGKATDGRAGIFLDNLRFSPDEKAAWTNLLRQVRSRCGDVPILVNAGWDSEDLEWIAPLINGIMYEDSIAHTEDQNPERFYQRVQSHWNLLCEPRLSVNEVFGKRADQVKMRRELVRTLVYTDAALLYADSTYGHHHDWWPEWSLAMGKPVDAARKPKAGVLARRAFANGLVAWQPADAQAMAKLKLERPLRLWGSGESVTSIELIPGQGAVLVGDSPVRP